MTDREQARRPAPARETTDAEVETGESMDVEVIEDLLDEIDEILEENAEEFVRNYVQKGGQ